MVLGDRMSPTYNRRQELMRSLRVPTISETKANLGLPLSLVVFEETTDVLKEDMGLTPPLQGPIGELWMSPSDLLIEKVCLKPPFTQKHTQALTHQGILKIGAQIEQKYWNEMKIERDTAMAEREAYLTRMFELEKNKIVAEALEEEEEKRVQQIDKLRKYYESKLNELIWNCYTQIKELEECQLAEINAINSLWQQKLEADMQLTVQNITDEFLRKLRRQERVLVNIFTKQINGLKWKHKCALEFEKIKSKELMLQLRHHLECQNIANLMYVLCKERRKCKGEKIEIKSFYKKEIEKLDSQIKQQSVKVKNLIRIKNKRQKQLNVREKCLIEILSQFKKFIYFALQAAPTQGEFLLNLEKLIKYEIDDYCFDPSQEKEIAQINVINEDILALSKSSSSQKYEIEEFFNKDVASSSNEEIHENESESDAFPAFFFNEKLYVREDFRDKFCAGIEIDKSHPLWNKDVEELLNIFKKSIDKRRSNSQVIPIKSHPSSVHFHQQRGSDSVENISDSSVVDEACTMTSQPSPPPKPSPKGMKTHSPQSITEKNTHSIDDDEYEIRKVSLAGSIDESRKSEKRLTKRASYIKEMGRTKSEEFDMKQISNKTQSKLLLARDSIILLISSQEKKSLEKFAKLVDEPKGSHEEISEEAVHEPQVLETCELEPSTKSESGSLGSKIAIGSRATSKLTLAQDSFELIKSTIALVEKAESPPRSVKKTVKISKKPKTKQPQTHRTGTTTTSRTAKIVGAKKIKEKPVQEFTNERIKSLVDIMKDNPSLIGLFTKCSK